MRALLQRLSAPPKQTLHTLQPTPSTVLYTVATRAHPQSLVASFIHYISLQIRFIIGLTTLSLLWKKWGLTFQQPTKMLDWILGPGEQWLSKLIAFAEKCEWMYLGPGALVVLYLVCKREYTEESLLVLRGLGVQTSSTSSTYLQTPAKRFIPTTNIRDIVIHEAFKGFEVRFYLAIIVEGEEDVVVVFPKMLPRRAVLEEVWRGARRCLWDGQKSPGGEADENKRDVI